MGNLPAALARAQLGAVLRERCQRWNQRYAWMAEALSDIAQIRLPRRDPREQFVASSIQFSLPGLTQTPRISSQLCPLGQTPPGPHGAPSGATLW